MLCLPLALTSACESGGATSKGGGEVLTTIGGQPLHAKVVEGIAKRDGVDLSEAQARGEKVLRLVEMRRESLGLSPSDELPIDPQRAAQLRAAALVRAYLDDVFEPQSTADKMPSRYLDELMSLPGNAQRHFHPKVHFVCQAIVRPPLEEGAKVPSRIPKDDARWKQDAVEFSTTLLQHVRDHEQELSQEEDCSLYERLYSLHKGKSEDGRMEWHFEQGAYEVNLPGQWDQGFIDAVSPIEEPALVEPFFTDFGYHVTVVPKILEDTSLVPRDATDVERQAAQREGLREKFLTQWRATEAFPNHLQALRESFVVRVAEGVSQPPGAPTAN